MDFDNPVPGKCTLEDLGRAGLKMYQLKEGFRFGTDSALLAWFSSCFVRKGDISSPCRVLELGSGCGACSLLVLGRKENTTVDMVEIMKQPYEVLCENIRLNNLTSRANAYNCDLRDLCGEVKSRQYDLVMFNPPFFLRERGTGASEDLSIERLNGRFEENGSLQDFVDCAAARVIPSSGYVVMIMKGNRLKECIDSFSRAGITPERLLTVHPFSDKKASMILLAGKRGSRSTELRILPPLILNGRAGGKVIPSKEADHIYNDPHDECFI